MYVYESIEKTSCECINFPEKQNGIYPVFGGILRERKIRNEKGRRKLPATIFENKVCIIRVVVGLSVARTRYMRAEYDEENR